MRADRIPLKPVATMTDAILETAQYLHRHTQPTARPRWRDTTTRPLILGVARQWVPPMSAAICHRVQVPEACHHKRAIRRDRTMHPVHGRSIWAELTWELSRGMPCMGGGTNRGRLDSALASTTRTALLEPRPSKTSGGLGLTATPGRRWSLCSGIGIVGIVWHSRTRTEPLLVTCQSKSGWSAKGNVNENV